jgi:hypothetical protein
MLARCHKLSRRHFSSSSSSSRMRSSTLPPAAIEDHNQEQSRSSGFLALTVMLIFLSGCAPFQASDPSIPAKPDYGPMVSSYFRQTFKGISPNSADALYTDFEISGLRWVHARTGWNWLVCVRFNERGKSRTFALYIDTKAVDASQTFETVGKLTEQDIERINRLKSAKLQVQGEARYVAEARYAVVVDDCGSQSYMSFNVATGAIGQMIPPQLQPTLPQQLQTAIPQELQPIH